MPQFQKNLAEKKEKQRNEEKAIYYEFKLIKEIKIFRNISNN